MGIKFSHESVRYIKNIYETGENYFICISYNIQTYIIMSYRISVVPSRQRQGTAQDLEEYLNRIGAPPNKIEGSPFSHNGELCVLVKSGSPLASRSSAFSGSAFSGRGGKSRARKGYNKYMKKTRKRN